jgi:hypothetical protein
MKIFLSISGIVKLKVKLVNYFWLPQIRAAKFIVLGSRIVNFGQQLRYFFGQLNYLLWTANNLGS